MYDGPIEAEGVMQQGTRDRGLTWIVDPDRNAVQVFRRRNDGSLSPAVTLTPGDVLTTTLLDSLEIRLDAFFA